MEQQKTQKSLDSLIAYVDDIPDRIRARLNTGIDTDEDKMHSWIAEELQEQVRRIRFTTTFGTSRRKATSRIIPPGVALLRYWTRNTH